MLPFRYMMFSMQPDKRERQAIKTAKPGAVLLSYAYWYNQSVKELIDYLEYRPYIMIDSGAYTFSKKKTGNSMIQPYTDWLRKNFSDIDSFISMDDMNSPEISYDNWCAMRQDFPDIVPVFHYGNDPAFLDRYVREATYICLGGSANKQAKEKAAWVQPILYWYPDKKFHLLGTNSPRLINELHGLWSADGTTWTLEAKRKAHQKGVDRMDAMVDEIINRQAAVLNRPKYLF